MAHQDGYISRAEGLTVANLREVLSGAQAGEAVELVDMSDGVTTPIVAVMLSDESTPTKVYLYTEMP